MRVLREQVTVQVGHPVAHDEIVDLLRSGDLIDDSCRTSHICPKPRELVWREFRHVDDMFSKDHEAVSGVMLISSEPYVTRAGCRDEGTVLARRQVCVRTHAALLGRRQRIPFAIRPPHGFHGKRPIAAVAGDRAVLTDGR